MYSFNTIFYQKNKHVREYRTTWFLSPFSLSSFSPPLSLARALLVKSRRCLYIHKPYVDVQYAQLHQMREQKGGD